MNQGSEEEVNLEQEHKNKGYSFLRITVETGVMYPRLRDFCKTFFIETTSHLLNFNLVQSKLSINHKIIRNLKGWIIPIMPIKHILIKY